MGERQKTLKMLAGKCGEWWNNVKGGSIMILKNSFVCRQDIVLQCDTATVRKPFNWLDSPRGCAVVRKKNSFRRSSLRKLHFNQHIDYELNQSWKVERRTHHVGCKRNFSGGNPFNFLHEGNQFNLHHTKGTRENDRDGQQQKILAPFNKRIFDFIFCRKVLRHGNWLCKYRKIEFNFIFISFHLRDREFSSIVFSPPVIVVVAKL